MLGHGWHVNLQKPICIDLDEAARMAAAAAAAGTHPPGHGELPLLRAAAAAEGRSSTSGEIGEVAGYHLKMVASGRGGWDVPGDTYRWQFEQARRAGASCCSTTAGTSCRRRCGCSARSARSGPGSARPRSSPGSPSTRPPRSSGSTRAGSAACGTSPSPSTSTCGRTTTRTTSGGRSPGGAASPGSTGARPGDPAAEPRGLPGRRAALPPRARRRLGQQLPRPRVATGCGGSGPATDRCCGVPDEAIDVLRVALAAYASSRRAASASTRRASGRARPLPPPGRGDRCHPRAGRGMTAGPFAAATAVTPAGPSEWQGEIRPGWDIGGNANGGYLLAIGARALLAATGRTDPVTVTAHYLAPGRPGPVSVETRVLKEGRRFTDAFALLEAGADPCCPCWVRSATWTGSRSTCWWTARLPSSRRPTGACSSRRPRRSPLRSWPTSSSTSIPTTPASPPGSGAASPGCTDGSGCRTASRSTPWRCSARSTPSRRPSSTPTSRWPGRRPSSSPRTSGTARPRDGSVAGSRPGSSPPDSWRRTARSGTSGAA